MPITDDELELVFRAIEDEERRRERVQERRALHAVRPHGGCDNVVPLRRRVAGDGAA